MSAPVKAKIGQRNTLKGSGLAPAGEYESLQMELPQEADSIVSYFSRKGMPASVFHIDQYVSFDSGDTWEYAGGLTLTGGPATPRNGIVPKENGRVIDIPPERGQPRIYKVIITSTEPHDISIDLSTHQGGAKKIASQLMTRME